MDGGMSNEQKVWMGLSSGVVTVANTLLPRLMKEIMENPGKFEESEEESEITFPSNYEWRTQIYLKLLAKQKDAADRKRAAGDDFYEDEENVDTMEDDPQGRKEVLHDWNIIPAKKKKAPYCAPDAARLKKKEFISGPGPITWTVSDIAKAGCLLSIPPLQTNFIDEQEMRRVYTLIYDVYRYKTILNQTLKDSAFFPEYSNLQNTTSRVWLLLFDLYHRSFKKRTVNNAILAQALFLEAGLQEAEDALWTERVKLAASMARLRIKHSALRLNQLLPHHLRDEKGGLQGTAPVTCWVNTKKIKNPDDVVVSIEKSLNLVKVEETEEVKVNNFKWDTHCPQFIIFHPSIRTRLAQSPLTQKHKLIVQDRSFCLGPATFGKIVTDLQLTGTVIQSHVNSPRTTAYLASLLSQNDNIKKILVFSAGNRKQEYESYFHDLGIKNVLIFSEKLIDLPPDSSSLEEVIAVFATPPNSYSAVNDPIDLVCSRGGDLSMLEILTETEDTPEGRRRVASILEEQNKTLKYAMSRPQIQFVLYETHSEIEAENVQMVQKTINEINRCAKLHHAAMQGKLKQIQASEEAEDKEINNNQLATSITDNEEDGETTAAESISSQSLTVSTKKTKILSDVTIPDCDIFDVSKLPDLCPNISSCIKLSKEGCYLALLQRKQVTRLDNKYMIEMAETRGLFGSETNKKSHKTPKKKEKERPVSPPTKLMKRNREFEVDRIAAHTFSSLTLAKKPPPGSLECPKTKEKAKVPQTRRWWTESTRHITNLRASLSKQKILPPAESKDTAHGAKTNAKKFVNTLIRHTQRVDEIVAKSTKVPSNIPVYPKLRLTRFTDKLEKKVPIPIHVTMVTFPATSYQYSYDNW